jgi:hypothetical protein
MTLLIAETIAIIAFLYLFFSGFFLLQYNSDIGLGNCGDRSQYRYSENLEADLYISQM